MERSRKLCLAGMVTAISLSLSGCLAPGLTQEHLPEETIERYEDAINAMDAEEMLACMDESTRNAMTAGLDVTMGIVGAVTGVDLGIEAEDLIDMMPLLTAIAGEYGTLENPQVDFQVTKTLIKGDKATVYFTEVSSGQESVINMTKESGQWYMTMDVVLLTDEEADRIIIPGQEEIVQGEEGEGEAVGLGGLSLEDLIKLPLSEIFDFEKIQEWVESLGGGEDAEGLTQILLEKVLGR